MNPLEVRALQFSYGRRPILQGLDLALREGEVLCIFGPNGCGKTTMFECILGLLKPRSGSILLEGRSLSDLRIPEIARKMALVPQKQQPTFGYTVLEMVLMGRTAGAGLFSSPGKEDEKIAEQALRQVGMLSFRNHVFNQLSGGEAQLVKLARALAQRTRIILFDEPTSHLDFRHELNVIQYMCKLVRELGCSLMMTTHFPNQALYLENQGVPTRVALMEQGRIYAQGSAAETLTEQNMSRVFQIRTKVYQNYENGRRLTYMMPL